MQSELGSHRDLAQEYMFHFQRLDEVWEASRLIFLIKFCQEISQTF